MRPFPLSTAGRDERFSLSEDTEVGGEGESSSGALLLLRFRFEGGGGDAP